MSDKVEITLIDWLIRREHGLGQGAIAAGRIDMTAAGDLRKAAAIIGYAADEIQRAAYYGRGMPELPRIPVDPKHLTIFTSEDAAEMRGGEAHGALLESLDDIIGKRIDIEKTFLQGTMREEDYIRLRDYLYRIHTWTIRDIAIRARNSLVTKLDGKSTSLIREYAKADWKPDFFCPICGDPLTGEAMIKDVSGTPYLKAYYNEPCDHCQAPASALEPYPGA